MFADMVFKIFLLKYILFFNVLFFNFKKFLNIKSFLPQLHLFLLFRFLHP